ncbi:MAG: gamma-glutamyltransferase [Kofleriaceae bacterium]|nr:gamma-glutamyltransferase [Kofleriaceae bacterium]
MGRSLSAALAIALVATPGHAAHGPPLESTRGVVAADQAVASQVGAAVLADGGNAVDAAVATALALGVVNPASSGIGGGGFAIVWDAGARSLHVYDFREIAPAALDPAAFVVDGKVDPMRARQGGLAVGVPGEVRGLAHLSRRHGRLSWRRLVLPAARLAREGTPTSWFLAQAAAASLPRLPDEASFAPLRALLGGDRARTRGPAPAPAGSWPRPCSRSPTTRRAVYRGPWPRRPGGDRARRRRRDDRRGTWPATRSSSAPRWWAPGAACAWRRCRCRRRADRSSCSAGPSASSSAPARASPATRRARRRRSRHRRSSGKHGAADRSRLLGDSDGARARRPPPCSTTSGCGGWRRGSASIARRPPPATASRLAAAGRAAAAAGLAAGLAAAAGLAVGAAPGAAVARVAPRTCA